MICALPMYPFPEDHLRIFWSTLRQTLQRTGIHDVPLTLDQPDDLLQHWQRNDLLLSQSCGFPVSTLLRGKVQVLGAFHFDVPGCQQSAYSSSLLVRKEDCNKPLAGFRDAVAVCNERHSQSGYHALRSAVAPLAVDGRFFSRVLFSGAHRRSAQMIASGEADIAAIDCVSAFLLRQQEPATFDRLASIDFTSPMPGLPLITSQATPAAAVAQLRQALATCSRMPELTQTLQAMRISGFSALDQEDYRICAAKAEQTARDGLAEW
ncbi:ABC-type phosphate/phosphonate transport system [Collimonas arenae]|uniref:ABC-type phosphate/phosphonate transport system n=1 Tax=Collimonas arenae TaxID=279058 RepID=A0A0A1FD59_9BURK|nr:PhnD/SsuA/transferrin family substrate-binding protein [Collimonas arenae]AIY41619.1 ABC-type phosphate/phosphonate transport system [Collimonas arenae]